MLPFILLGPLFRSGHLEESSIPDTTPEIGMEHVRQRLKAMLRYFRELDADLGLAEGKIHQTSRLGCRSPPFRFRNNITLHNIARIKSLFYSHKKVIYDTKYVEFRIT